jgi:hypothetical protein
MNKLELKQVIVEAFHEYNTEHKREHDCFLVEEERQILKDFIQIGRWVKKGVLMSLAAGSFGLGFFALALWVGWHVAKAVGLPG